ncbi:hypothetical protein IWW50_001910 [Coemansia erecta]|nr:hypothetical protein GGF43_001179 [Coemansia sp. RSA 2618]KAJ2827394.1 hypothetical protein IWW50_001910 [Coemansia erecta]
MKGCALIAALWMFLGTSFGDIVLSVATPTDTSSYLDVLSHAWPTLYSKLDAQLQVAQEHVPAEHSFLLSLLGVTAVPSTYDAKWAEQFLNTALEIGPTTIINEDIEGAEADAEALFTSLLTTNDEGDVGVLESVPLERPTIIVAVNGNVGRMAHDAQSQSDGDELSDESSEESGMDDVESTKSGASMVRSAALTVSAGAVLAMLL